MDIISISTHLHILLARLKLMACSGTFVPSFVHAHGTVIFSVWINVAAVPAGVLCYHGLGFLTCLAALSITDRTAIVHIPDTHVCSLKRCEPPWPKAHTPSLCWRTGG